MPATLHSIRGKTAEVRIYIGDPDIAEAERSADDYFTLYYRQHNLTGNIEKMARRAEDDNRQLEALVDMCLPVFESWDLKAGATEEQSERLRFAHRAGDTEAIRAIEEEIAETVQEQEPIPITKDGLMEYVPASVLILILEQINESRVPTKETGKSSRKR